MGPLPRSAGLRWNSGASPWSDEVSHGGWLCIVLLGFPVKQAAAGLPLGVLEEYKGIISYSFRNHDEGDLKCTPHLSMVRDL